MAKKHRCRVPQDLLSTLQKCRSWAGELVAMSGSKETLKGRQLAMRACLRNLKPLRSVVLTAEASGISSWASVRSQKSWPTNHADIPAYCVLLVYRDLWGLVRDSEIKDADIETIRERQLNLSAAIGALPLEDLIFATIALREDARARKRRSGPLPVEAPRRGTRLRL